MLPLFSIMTLWLDPTTVGQMASPQAEGEHTHVIQLTPTHSSHLAPKTGAVPPTFQIRSHSRAHHRSSFSPSSGPLFSHPKEERPLWLLLLHFFRHLIWAAIEPHPGHVQDPCSVCGSQTYAGCIAFLSFYERCATAAAPGSIPQQTTGGWPR